MNIASLNTFAGTAAAQASQTASADSDHQLQRAVTRSNATDSLKKTAEAAGIGQTEQEESAGDRDADGRRVWEIPPSQKTQPETPEETAAEDSPPDPLGECGQQIDILG